MNEANKYSPDLEDLREFVRLDDQKKVGISESEGTDLYRKNLDALGEHHPDLVDVLHSISVDESRIEVFDSESGNPRIRYTKDDGVSVNIHSSEDPIACAQGAIDLLGKIEKEGIIVLFGFGLGYFAQEIYKRFEKGHLLLVYEATPEVFKYAMKIIDFRTLFSSDRVKIILGKDADNFSVIHSHHHLIVNGKFWVVEHKPSVKLNSSAYEKFFKRLNEEKSLSDIGVATNVRRGKDFMNAFLSNVHSVIRNPGVAGLKNLFKGRAAIVVSAGPSLDNNIHLLKRAKGKAVIIAAGGALPTLISSDIIPDLIVEIDPVTENIEEKFQGIPELKKVPFVCLAQYTPQLMNIYPGPLFINSAMGNLAYQWLMNFWEDKGTIECFGGSVAHLAFATAEYIGADVIVFVGQDLSYKRNRLHTVGYSDSMDRRLEEGAIGQAENILGGIPVQDIFGEEVLSIPQFITFKTSFENRIKGLNKVVINASEQGLPIDGVINMRLTDVIDEYVKDEDELDTFAILSDLLNSELSYNLDGLIDEITKARNTFEKIKKTSKRILRYTKKVKKLKGSENNDSPELHNILNKIGTLVKQVQHPGMNLLVGYNYGLELYLSRQEIKDIDDMEDKWEMLDKQIQRADVYYNEIIRTISLFNKQLDKTIVALKREKVIDLILQDETLGEEEKYYRAGLKYEEAGLSSRASRYLELSRARSSGHDKNDEDKTDQLISKKRHLRLAESYMRQYRFYEANEILNSIGDRDSCGSNRRSAIAEKLENIRQLCSRNIRAWEQRRNQMDIIVKTAEKNYGSHLESGYFYFRIRDFKRAEKAYMNAVSNEEIMAVSQDVAASYYGLAHTYLAMNKSERAVEALEKALGADPSNPILYRDLGLIAAESNNVEPAKLFFAKAIELSPGEAELYRPLANLYMSLGEKERALSLYENAMQEHVDNPSFQKDLASIYNESIVVSDS
jgi:tetratricopeptide (TPR) repeat protein